MTPCRAVPVGFCPRLVVLQECVAGGCLACAGLPCDIEIKGADENRDGNIPWGIDGSYKLIGCYARYPVYKREGKTRLRASLQLFHPHPGNNGEHAGRRSALASKHDPLNSNCLHGKILHQGHATNCPFCRSTAMYLRHNNSNILLDQLSCHTSLLPQCPEPQQRKTVTIVT